jgi:hypothetical protein
MCTSGTTYCPFDPHWRMFIILISWCRQSKQFKLHVLISFSGRCFNCLNMPFISRSKLLARAELSLLTKSTTTDTCRDPYKFNPFQTTNFNEVHPIMSWFIITKYNDIKHNTLDCLYQQCYVFWSFSQTIIRHKHTDTYILDICFIRH